VSESRGPARRCGSRRRPRRARRGVPHRCASAVCSCVAGRRPRSTRRIAKRSSRPRAIRAVDEDTTAPRKRGSPRSPRVAPRRGR
jgi:hypothetical protein